MFDGMFSAAPSEDMCERMPIRGSVCELDTVVSEQRMDSVWHSLNQISQERCGHHFVGFGVQLGKSEFAGSVNRDNLEIP
jgi:hypothetical protein